MTPEERIAELENNCKAMTEELEKLKTELAKKNETVWIPESDDLYMYVDPSGSIIKTFFRGDNELNNRRINFNNAYHSNNTTQKHLKWYTNNILRVQNKLMQLHELLCPDYFPNWNSDDWDSDEDKWSVYYDTNGKYFTSIPWNYMNHFIVCFTKEAAEKACKILNQEKFMIENT